VNPQRWERLLAAIEAVRQLPADERAAALEGLLGDDRELLAEALEMLAADPGGDFLRPPGEPPSSGPEEGPNRRLGEFELLRLLGEGGMSRVHLARQLPLDRLVAVKLLGPHPSLGEAEIERFHREARAVARLRHPGIVQVYADGQTDGIHWFAMEYVPGHDLGRELELQRSGVPLAGDPEAPADQRFLPKPGEARHIANAARLCADVAEALEHAHQHGLVHRDVKPSNLLLQPDGRIQLGDFGIAQDGDLLEKTRSGALLGTPHYMSPEQVRAQRLRIDHRSDIYSLGVVLYELLTLARPFEGRSLLDVFDAIRAQQPRPVRSLNRHVPRDLATICHKAMSKAVDDRFESAAEMAADLRRFLAHDPIRSRPLSLWERFQRWVVSRRTNLAWAGALLATVLLGLGLALRWRQQAQLGQLSLAVRWTEAAPSSVRWSLARIDPIDGSAGTPRPLSRSGRFEGLVEPGYLRLVLEAQDLGSRSFVRELAAGESLRLELDLSPRPTSLDGMLWIRGAVLALDDPNAPLVPFNGRSIPLAGFWIDAAEVSNREYRAFLEASGHPAPGHWAEIGPEHDDLPIVNIGWRDARAFAEWAGKRLPSMPEWTLAARGVELRRYPWPDDGGGPRGNVQAPHRPGPQAEQRAQYFEFVRPVRSFPDARSPEGAFHLFGNVAEWTESPQPELTDSGFVPTMWRRIVAGHGWDAARIGPGLTLEDHGFQGIESADSEFKTGFRCVADAPAP
jgi:serine/threonine protein kinase/formylglycine-generating enzyme required for sulfatase activity